jgi:hypothetical protein
VLLEEVRHFKSGGSESLPLRQILFLAFSAAQIHSTLTVGDIQLANTTAQARHGASQPLDVQPSESNVGN